MRFVPLFSSSPQTRHPNATQAARKANHAPTPSFPPTLLPTLFPLALALALALLLEELPLAPPAPVAEALAPPYAGVGSSFDGVPGNAASPLIGHVPFVVAGHAILLILGLYAASLVLLGILADH